MTKKIMSLNYSESAEKETNKTTKSENSFEKLHSSKDSGKTINNTQKMEYIYSTPLKRIKLNQPKTPKKKKKFTDIHEYNIRGKNLFNIFKLIA